MKDPRQWLKTALERGKDVRYPLLILLAGLVLLAWPSGRGEAPKESLPSGPKQSAYDLEELERRLERSLSQVEGVGKAEVVLTVSSLSREVLAQDESRRGEEVSRTTVVLRGSDRGETTVTTQVILPTFQGALVVCDGGESAAVRLKVVRAVSALTGLGADHITVCARTGG